MHILACPPQPVPNVGNLLPPHWAEKLEQNQLIESCCRHPENHTIAAWYTSEVEQAKGVPDLYIFTCTCGRRHPRLCVGTGERPYWEVH